MYSRDSENRRFGSKNDEFWTKPERFVFYPEIEMLQNHLSWFRLERRTDGIIEAFSTMPRKIQDRLHDKKDFEEVASCLRFLSGYFYFRIPDVPALGWNVAPANYADENLQAFVQSLGELPSYTTEIKPTGKPVQIGKVIASGLGAISTPFTHTNVFVCFLAWYVLTLTLTLTALKMALHFSPDTQIDSVLVSLIVGGPLACAVSAVAISRARNRDESEDH
jgi:hypothetical protein